MTIRRKMSALTSSAAADSLVGANKGSLKRLFAVSLGVMTGILKDCPFDGVFVLDSGNYTLNLLRCS